MDWNNIKHFNKDEFTGNADLACPILIRKLDIARGLLGERMFPSTATGTLARFGGSPDSEHYVGESPKRIIRQATASDQFVEGIPFQNFMVLFHSGLFKGIGIYLDTQESVGKPWPMFHLDTRDKGYADQPLVWIAIKAIRNKKLQTIYLYPQHDNRHWARFADKKLYQQYEV